MAKWTIKRVLKRERSCFPAEDVLFKIKDLQDKKFTEWGNVY